MTYVKISGIKIVRAKSGEVYRYHRGTGRRLKANPDTHLQAFLEEVKALDAQTAAPPPAEKPGTLGALFVLYKASPEFTQLKPASKIGYQRAIDALKSQHDKPLFEIDQPYILELRDEVFDARGRWLANMVVKTRASCWAGACRAAMSPPTPPRACRRSAARPARAFPTRHGGRPSSTLS